MLLLAIDSAREWSWVVASLSLPLCASVCLAREKKKERVSDTLATDVHEPPKKEGGSIFDSLPLPLVAFLACEIEADCPKIINGMRSSYRYNRAVMR